MTWLPLLLEFPAASDLPGAFSDHPDRDLVLVDGLDRGADAGGCLLAELVGPLAAVPHGVFAVPQGHADSPPAASVDQEKGAAVSVDVTEGRKRLLVSPDRFVQTRQWVQEYKERRYRRESV
jgi:hypothetical protein